MTRRAPLFALLLLAAGCAALAGRAARDRELEARLAAWRSPEPLERAWDEARRLLVDRGYPLADADADAVGARRMSQLEKLGSPASATSARGPLERTLQTGWGEARVRYVVQSLPAGDGFRVAFWRVEEGAEGQPVAPRRDLDLELELVRRLDPAAAARIDAAAGAAR